VGDDLTEVALFYDAVPDAGLGHRRRMEALADALVEQGVHPRLVTDGSAVTASLVVVDSYLHRADDTEMFHGEVVAAVDDLARELAVDVVVDPAPGATPDDHPAAGMVLAGASFALLGPEIGRCLQKPVARNIETVLVVGGASVRGSAFALSLAKELRASLPERVGVDVVAPGATTGDAMPMSRLISTADGLGPILAGADLVVTAAGVTMLESLALGRPTVAFVLAENQRRQAEGAAAAGAVLLVDPHHAVKAALELVGSFNTRATLSESGRSLIDGHGARRVALELLAYA
jgi:spore coat polysaccharide biosynthesis predicted glycosyltransferase SpsG